MDKFTKKPKPQTVQIKTLWEGPYFNVVSNNGYEYVDKKDGIVVFPILMPNLDVILRVEPIPSYHSRSGSEEHISFVSGQMDEGEDPFDTAVRELYEETGIKITNKSWDNYQLLDSLFIRKMSNDKIWFYLFVLYPEDYDQTIPQGDGTKWEEESKNFVCNINQLDRIKCSDVITRLGIDLLKRNFGGI